MAEWNPNVPERKKRYPDEYRRLAAKMRQVDKKEIWYIQYQLQLLYPHIPIPNRKTIGRWVDEFHGKEIIAAQELLDAANPFGQVQFAPTEMVSKFLQGRRRAMVSAIVNSGLEALIKDYAIPEELYRNEDKKMLLDEQNKESENGEI